MNKKFSTLLAGILLVGSSFSAMAQETINSSQFYQLGVNGQDDVLIVDKSGVKDSLVAKPVAELTTYEEINQSLWKIDVEPVKFQGTVAGYTFTLTNKSGTKLMLSKEGANATDFLYGAKPAYTAATASNALTSLYVTQNVTIADNGDVTITGVVPVQTQEYNPADETFYTYYLERDKTAETIKLRLKTAKDAAPTPAAEDGTKTELINLQIVRVDPYTFGAADLNPEEKDAFKLVFTPDVNKEEFENPFTANKLRIEENALWTAAKYDNTYTPAADQAKAATDKAVALLEKAYGDYKTEVGKAIDDVAGMTGLSKGDKVLDKTANAAAVAATKDLLGTGTTLGTYGAGSGALKYFNVAGKVAKVVANVITEYGKINVGTADKLNTGADGDTKAYNEAVKAADKAISDLKDLLGKAETGAFPAINAVYNAYRTAEQTETTPTFEGAAATALAAIKNGGAILKEFADSKETANAAFENEDPDGFAAPNPAFALETWAGLATSGDLSTSGGAAALAGKYYAIALVDSFINGQQAYLTVDTNYVAVNEEYFRFKADVLHAVKDKDALVPRIGQPAELFAFKISTALDEVAGDSLLIDTYMPVKGEDGFYVSGEPATARVVIRTLANSHREVSVVAYDLDEPANNTASDIVIRNTKVTFNNLAAETAKLEKGTPYYVKSLKKEYETKPYYMMTSTTGDALAHSAVTYANVPATQWFVSSADDDASEYAIANRDFNKELVEAQKFYVIDADKKIYEIKGDTIQLEEVKDVPAGYKNLSKEAIDNQTYKLIATNFANPTKTFYLTMSKDSSVVMTDDAESSLVFKMKTNTPESLADATLKANKYNGEVYFGNDTLFLKKSASKKVVLTKIATKNEADLTLRRTSDKAGQYEILWRPSTEARNSSDKVAVDQNGYVVVVGKEEITNWAFDLDANTTNIYLNVTDAPKNITLSLMGDEASKVTAVKPFAEIKRTGLELKAAATDNDFVLGLDTAYVEREDNFRYAYYITKAIDTEKVGAFDKKAYMVSYADSTDTKDVKYSQDGLTRVGFIYANRVDNASGDSLAIGGKTDTLDIAKDKGLTNATWAFAIDKKIDGFYRIEGKDGKYVSYLNGILVLGNKDQAQLFAIND
uniref:hypothetical protein n=1 Tax=Parabacteroides sp. AM08-6 TaxID=2292053 RepID=UPI000FF2C170